MACVRTLEASFVVEKNVDIRLSRILLPKKKKEKKKFPEGKKQEGRKEKNTTHPLARREKATELQSEKAPAEKDQVLFLEGEAWAGG